MTTLTAPAARGLVPEAVFVRRSLLHSLRDGESLLMAIMLPVMLMLLFTFVFGGAIDATGSYVDYVTPGIILLCAGFGASSTALYVANDTKTGIVDRFRTMPIRASAVLTGHVVSSLLRNLLATAIVIGVALLVGFRPTAGLAGWVGAVLVIALYILAITYLFAAIGLAAGSPEAANGYGSSCCSCRTCRARSCRCPACPTGSSRSRSTSRSLRSSRRSADCSWAHRRQARP